MPTFHLYETGPAEAPTLLFLHGAGLSGRAWQPQMHTLTKYHCLAPDLPAHGQSRDIPFDLGDAVQRLSELIEQKAQDGTAHVIGLSLGGALAQALMVKAPGRCRRVILSGTAPRMGKTMQGLLKVNLALNRPLLRLLSPSQIAWLTALQFGIPKEARELVGEDMKRFQPEALEKITLAYGEIPAAQELRGQVLVAVGGKETPFAKAAARRLARQVQGAQGVLAPGVGHVWNLQAPDLFSRMVWAWVRGEPLPRELKVL